jgi:hypothetical protein
MNTHSAAVAALVIGIAGAAGAYAQTAPNMTFFISSVGSGNGADLGGLEGADRHCQTLAQAVGAGNRTWRAYLSAANADGKPAVHAKDRIGQGPWHNAKGVQIAANVAELHGDANKIDKATGLTEKGAMVNARGDTPNMHDILTGSNPDGTASGRTCNNWTSSGQGSAIVGHHDRLGLRYDAGSQSWNSSHPSIGCGQQELIRTGGNGLIYCFAAQ